MAGLAPDNVGGTMRRILLSIAGLALLLSMTACSGTKPEVVAGGFEYKGALHDGALDKKNEAEALAAARKNLRSFFYWYYSEDGKTKRDKSFLPAVDVPDTLDELVAGTHCYLIPDYQLTRSPTAKTTDLFAISKQVPSRYTLVFVYRGELLGSCDWFNGGQGWTSFFGEPDTCDIAYQEEWIQNYTQGASRVVRYIYSGCGRWAVFSFKGKQYAEFERIQGDEANMPQTQKAYTIPELAQFDFKIGE